MAKENEEMTSLVDKALHWPKQQHLTFNNYLPVLQQPNNYYWINFDPNSSFNMELSLVKSICQTIFNLSIN